MNTTHALSAASLRVASCRVPEDEVRFVHELASAIAAAEKSLVDDPNKREYQRLARIGAGISLTNILHSVMLHRLDGWLNAGESRVADRVHGPPRSKSVLVRYLKDRTRPREKQNHDAIPSLLDIAHWIFSDSQLQPQELAREISDALGVRNRDPGTLSNLFLAGQFRNVLAHRTDYEKQRAPAAISPELAAWVYRTGDGIDVHAGALDALSLLALNLLQSNTLLEPIRASAPAAPVAPTPAQEPTFAALAPAGSVSSEPPSVATTHARAQPLANPTITTGFYLTQTSRAPSSRGVARSRVALFALGTALLGGAIAAIAAVSGAQDHAPTPRSIAPSPTRGTAQFIPPVPAQRESPESVLARWDESVQRPVGDAFEDMYSPRTSIHGATQSSDSVAEALRTTWRHRIEGGGWFHAQHRTRNEDEPSRRPSTASRVCVDPGRPNARVVRFLAQAAWRDPSASRNPNVPCEELRGTFVWRLVETAAGWRICQESWDLADAICPSCPQAPACVGHSASPNR